MSLTRRTIMTGAGALSLTSALAGCAPNLISSSEKNQNRRLMINGNMVIPFDSEGALNENYQDQIRSTGLAAVKVSIGGSSGTYDDVHKMLDDYDREIAINDAIYMPINTVADIDAAFQSERVGIIKSFEAATMFEGDPARVKEFAERGVKVMQLGYNKTSPFGAGVMSASGPLGLTEAGRHAIAQMEANSVLLDLSHAHEQTTMDALAMTTRSASLTHTGCDAIHSHPRNKSDKVLRQVAEGGGVVGIYELSYLTPELTQTPLDAYLAHLQHALKVCGEDHVGVGSDALLLEFDTSPESRAQWDAINAARKEAGVAAPGEGPMPFVVGLNGPHRMHVIANELKKLGHGSSTIDKIMGQNFKRVFQDAWGA